jgi:hypothetical protein
MQTWELAIRVEIIIIGGEYHSKRIFKLNQFDCHSLAIIQTLIIL